MRIDRIGPEVVTKIECDGYVPLIIRFDNYQAPCQFAPNYWRFGDFRRSLIEVAVNPSNLAICKIVFTSLPRLSEKLTLGDETSIVFGLPIASPSQWSDTKNRIDIVGDVFTSLSDGKLMVLLGDTQPSMHDEIRCDSVTFFVNTDREIYGLQVNHLSEQDIANFICATNSVQE